MGSYGVCSCGIKEGYKLVDLLVVDGISEIGYSIGMSYGNRYDNIEGSPLG